STTDHDIHGQRFFADGKKNGKEFTVVSSPKSEFDPSVAMAANGDFVVSYTLQFSKTDTDVKAVQYRANGSVVRTINVASSTQKEQTSSVTAAADGRFAIAFQANDNIFVSRYSKDGVRQGSAPVAVANTARTERAPDVAMDNSGNLVVVWQELVG